MWTHKWMYCGIHNPSQTGLKGMTCCCHTIGSFCIRLMLKLSTIPAVATDMLAAAFEHYPAQYSMHSPYVYWQHLCFYVPLYYQWQCQWNCLFNDESWLNPLISKHTSMLRSTQCNLAQRNNVRNTYSWLNSVYLMGCSQQLPLITCTPLVIAQVWLHTLWCPVSQGPRSRQHTMGRFWAAC